VEKHEQPHQRVELEPEKGREGVEEAIWKAVLGRTVAVAAGIGYEGWQGASDKAVEVHGGVEPRWIGETKGVAVRARPTQGMNGMFFVVSTHEITTAPCRRGRATGLERPGRIGKGWGGGFIFFGRRPALHPRQCKVVEEEAASGFRLSAA
jgi:hypothetical protein